MTKPLAASIAASTLALASAYPVAAWAGGRSELAVSANIPAICSFASTGGTAGTVPITLDFGSLDPISSKDTIVTGAINVACTTASVPTVQVDGRSGTSASRTMKKASTVPQNPAIPYLLEWQLVAAPAAGGGRAYTLQLQGTVKPGHDRSVTGAYADEVRVTLTP